MIIDKSQKLLYIRVFENLRNMIETGQWLVGSQIPIEEELCKIYDVSKSTVRMAVLELVRQGYLMRQQGKGTFVSKRIIPEELTMAASFGELIIEAGIKFSTKVLAQTVMMPTDDLDLKLGIPEDKHIIYIRRLRSVNGEPILLQDAYIPYTICPSILKEDVEGKSLFELFEKNHNITITKMLDYFEVVHPKPEENRLLGLSAGSAALLLEQHFYSGDIQIMYMSSIKRPDRFRFLLEFDRRH